MITSWFMLGNGKQQHPVDFLSAGHGGKHTTGDRRTTLHKWINQYVHGINQIILDFLYWFLGLWPIVGDSRRLDL